jgi:cellulose synthase/poly-beta-1,6-N-acetylglucosamine synthase-like glycosyltransferase
MGLFLLWFFFAFGILIQVGFFLFVFSRTALYNPSPKKTFAQYPEEGVTVLVTARNKFQHLKVLIPKLFEQDYPKFDVMIVNDQSSDRTKRLLEDLMARYPKLRSVTLKYTPKHVTAKKYAITLGIKVAKNDVILLTDANTIPQSNQWIRKMTAPVREEGKTFALGYSGYEAKPGSLNEWIQFETILKALFYLSFSLWKSPFMGTGRNLSYRKSFFMEVNAFKGFWDLDGGDDTVFVNTYATGENTKVVIDPAAITVSTPKETLKEYLQQEKNALYAESFFRVEDKRKMGIFGISHALYWIGGLGLLIYFGIGGQWEHLAIVLGSMVTRSLLLLALFKATSKTVQGKQPKMNVLVNDLLYLAYFWVLGSISYQAKTKK